MYPGLRLSGVGASIAQSASGVHGSCPYRASRQLSVRSKPSTVTQTAVLDEARRWIHCSRSISAWDERIGGAPRKSSISRGFRTPFTTRDEKYRDVPAVYVPWTAESANLARHLAENLNRSDMTFWDKATGFLTFKVTREAELRAQLTLRKLEDEAKKTGLQASTLALYLFAAESLAELRHEIRAILSYDEIKALQPELTRIRALIHRIGEAGAFPNVLTSAIEIVNRQFISSGWSVRTSRSDVTTASRRTCSNR